MYVSPMGTATYSIPIEVSPGTCGVQPSLSITYNSVSGRGLLGVGWDLDGFSSITRTPRNIYFDNATGSVNFDENDRFALDGARLVNLSNGNYMLQNAVYGTEIENFTRVTLKGTPNDNSQYFIAVTDQGQIIEYGNTSDAKQTLNGKVLGWWANKITDPDGNYMNFQYSCSLGEIRPTQISYTGNTSAGVGTYARVTFQYISDPCLNKMWVGGQSITLSHLLSSVNVYYGNDLIRSYCFEYNHDRSTRLAAIILKDGTGNELTRTRVGWNNDEATVSFQSIYGLQGYVVLPGDFNGDDIQDLFLYVYDSGTGTTTWMVKKGNSGGAYEQTNLSGSLNGFINPDKISVVDFNDDCIDDVGFVLNVPGTTSFSYQKIVFNGSGFETSTLAQSGINAFYLGDFKGTGQLQVFKVVNQQGNNNTLTIENDNLSLTVPSSGCIRVTDINGNGKNELYVCDNRFFEIYEYDETTGGFSMILNEPHWMPYDTSIEGYGDFNGDGAQDHAFVIDDKTYMRLSKGNDYTPSYHMTVYDNIPSGSPMLVGDVNGDGKDDIVRLVFNYQSQKLTLHVFYSRTYSDTTLYCDTIQIQDDRVFLNTQNMYHFTDLNHDGKNELLYTGTINHDPVVVGFPERREHDLLKSVTNGLGKTVSLEYQFHNSPQFGLLGMDGRRVSFPLVSKKRQPDGIGGTNETTYNYGSVVFDHERRQFLGFNYHNSYCNGTWTALEFEKNNIYHHLALVQSDTYYYQSNREDPGGYVPDSSYWRPYRFFYHYETFNTPAYHALNYGRFIPYDSISSNVNRLENTKEMTYCWLNGEGRVVRTSNVHLKAKTENEIIPWVSRDSTKYTYTTVSLPNGRTAVKPSRVVHWNKRHGFSQMPSDTVEYTYSGGRLASVAVSDSDGSVGETTYTYNNFGLPATETYTPNGLTARTKTFGYDNKGRFMTQETDVLGHTQSATFNKYTGTMSTETDVNNLTTQYQYDSFGRVIRITRPDHTVHSISYRWNNNSNFGNAVYYSTETESGTPETRTYYDILGRAIHSYCEGQGYSDVVYDTRGRVEKTTFVPYNNPSAASSSKVWHNYSYDNFDRIVGESCPYTNLSYSYYNHGEAAQHDYFVTVVDNLRETQRTTKYDALGRPFMVVDEGGEIKYDYAYVTVAGKTRDSIAVKVGTAVTSIVSDLRGNRLRIQDPDAGTVTSAYNALNQLVNRNDANGNETAYTYDLAGRTTRIVRSHTPDEETVAFVYDNAPGKGIGKLASVQHNSDIECGYAYDTLGRLASRMVYDGHTEYEHLYGYDTLGRLACLTYPDGFQISYSYNDFGELRQICNASDNSCIYLVSTRNSFRQPVVCVFGNETGTKYNYNSYGMLTGIRNGNATLYGNPVQGGVIGELPVFGYDIGSQYRNLNYIYNYKGFIQTRTDSLTGQSETYYYDNLDRLESYRVNGVTAASFTYYDNGNIRTNSKVGTYSYDSQKTHAVTSIESFPRTTAPSLCDVTYNLRNRPETIYKDGYNIALDYDASGMRRHTVITNGQTLVKEKTWVSDLYELEATPTTSRRLDYIYAEGKVVAMHVNEGGHESLYYVLTDHLGSWEKVLDENKNTVQQTHFDPWGNRMSFTAWNTRQTQTTFTFDRGFTGHEHYDYVHVINANARLYDPIIGRFFSPDPFVQTPDFTQSFNRYSYCMNNPVMYNDPDGEFLKLSMWGLAFVGDFISNVVNGIDNPVQNAWNNAKTIVNGMDNCCRFSKQIGENTTFDVGVSPFTLSVYGGVSYDDGSTVTSAGLSYGVAGLNGYFYNTFTSDNISLTMGVGGGKNYFGWNVAGTAYGYGLGIGGTRYGDAIGHDGMSNPQTTGTISVYFKNGSFRIENDYFGDKGDRWRTNAWELTVGDYSLGSRIYTNDPEGMGNGTSNKPSPLWGLNRGTYGAWDDGFVYSCPLWIGIRRGNSISRFGYSHPLFQDATQNFVHKYCDFGRMHFYIDYNHFESGLYHYFGYYNPFSLY